MLTNLLIFFIHVCQVVELPISHNCVWTDSTIVEMWTGYLAFHYRATGVQSTHRRPESSTSKLYLSLQRQFSKQHARILYCTRCFTTRKVAGRTGLSGIAIICQSNPKDNSGRLGHLELSLVQSRTTWDIQGCSRHGV